MTVAGVEVVADEAHKAIKQRYLSGLRTDLRLLYQVVKKAGSISAPESRARDPVATSTRGKYLRKLQQLGLIESEWMVEERPIRLRSDGMTQSQDRNSGYSLAVVLVQSAS